MKQKGMICYRRGVAGAVLQTAWISIRWFTDDLPEKSLKHINVGS